MGSNSVLSREYIEHLPEIFRVDDESGCPSFLGQYLKIFEALLSGREDAEINNIKITGLEELIAGFADYLDPGLTPVSDSVSGALDSEFLRYIAKWVALVFDQNWTLDKKRQWLSKIVSLYKKRGSNAGLTEYLNMFVGNQVQVDEPPGEFIVGNKENSIVGKNTFIGEPVYFFWVKFNYGYPPEDFKINIWRNLGKGASNIIDLEKPAHTYYRLDARTPGIIVGGPDHPQNIARSTVGLDTLIWENSTKI